MEPEKQLLLSDISMREYLERILDERDRLYGAKFAASEVAVAAALIAQKTSVDAALVAADRAVAKAEIANEKRFESVNEFRGQLKDQAALFVNRTEYTSSRDQTGQLISVIRDQLANSVTRNEFQAAKDQAAQSIKANTDRTSMLVSRAEFEATREQFVQAQKASAERGAQFITRDESIALRSAIEKSIENLGKEVASLRESRSEVTGRSLGANALWGYLVALVGLAMALIFHFVK